MIHNKMMTLATSGLALQSLSFHFFPSKTHCKIKKWLWQFDKESNPDFMVSSTQTLQSF